MDVDVDVVIKGMELCGGNGSCKKCPYRPCCRDGDTFALERDALSLIKSQNAEIEELDHKLGWLLCHATGNKLSKSTYPLETMRSAVNDYIEDCCRDAVTGAVEEVAEKLRSKLSENTNISALAFQAAIVDMYNLVEEIKGGAGNG